MPLYEFYCAPCHTIFTFHARSVDTTTIPVCPRCKAPLKRELSPFAHIVKGATPEASTAPHASPNEERLAQAAEQCGARLQALEESDAPPQEVARLMRELAAESGVRFNAQVNEALARLEAGADPEGVEAEFGDSLESDNPFEDPPTTPSASSTTTPHTAPHRDPTWYNLP